MKIRKKYWKQKINIENYLTKKKIKKEYGKNKCEKMSKGSNERLKEYWKIIVKQKIYNIITF